MDITLIVANDVATELGKRVATSSEVDEILSVAGRFGASIKSTHPDVDDPDLGKSFTVEVGADADESLLLESLRDCGGVEAAYVKPADELP